MKELGKFSEETILLLSMKELIHLIDDDFESQNAAKCDLLIHLGIESIQYAIIDKVRDELKALVEYELSDENGHKAIIEKLSSLPESEKEFKYPFNKIKISIDSYHFTFIPKDLFQEGNEQEYAKFIETTYENVIISKAISAANIQNISKINLEMYHHLKNIFGESIILNQANPFLQGIIKNYLEKDTCLFVDVHEQHIQIAYLKDAKLFFYNILSCLNVDEFNYFILNAIETLKIDIKVCGVLLSGKITSGDAAHRRLEKYFGDIQFTQSELIVKHPEKFGAIPMHEYFSLIALDQCE